MPGGRLVAISFSFRIKRINNVGFVTNKVTIIYTGLELRMISGAGAYFFILFALGMTH